MDFVIPDHHTVTPSPSPALSLQFPGQKPGIPHTLHSLTSFSSDKCLNLKSSIVAAISAAGSLACTNTKPPTQSQSQPKDKVNQKSKSTQSQSQPIDATTHSTSHPTPHSHFPLPISTSQSPQPPQPPPPPSLLPLPAPLLPVGDWAPMSREQPEKSQPPTPNSHLSAEE